MLVFVCLRLFMVCVFAFMHVFFFLRLLFLFGDVSVSVVAIINFLSCFVGRLLPIVAYCINWLCVVPLEIVFLGTANHLFSCNIKNYVGTGQTDSVCENFNQQRPDLES